MTMPHLMNCSHSEDGWCLDCVKELYEEVAVFFRLDPDETARRIQHQYGNGNSPRPWVSRKMSCQSDSHTFSHEIIDANGHEVCSILRKADADFIVSVVNLVKP